MRCQGGLPRVPLALEMQGIPLGWAGRAEGAACPLATRLRGAKPLPTVLEETAD